MACAGVAALIPACYVVSTAAGAVGGDIISQIGNAFASAGDQAIKLLVTGWTMIPTPSVSASGGPAVWLQSQLKPLVIYIGALSIIAAVIRAVWTSRGEPAREIVAGLLRLVVVSGVGLAAIDALLQGGDALSATLLNAATPNGGNFGQIAVLSGAAAMEPVVLIFLGSIALLASFIQLSCSWWPGLPWSSSSGGHCRCRPPQPRRPPATRGFARQRAGCWRSCSSRQRPPSSMPPPSE